MKSIFITYNPNSEKEQVLAIRLHTLGAVNGFQMSLPDRSIGQNLSSETKRRIEISHWIVCFSMSPLSEAVKQELLYASRHKHDKSKIIVIYNKKKNIVGKAADYFSEYYYDSEIESSSDMMKKILDGIKNTNSKELAINKQDDSSLGWFLIAGLGILGMAAAVASSTDDEPKKGKSKKKNAVKSLNR